MTSRDPNARADEQSLRDDDAESATGKKEGGHSGPRITGRSFAGTSFASDQSEQTDDHAGRNRGSRMDDAIDPARPSDQRISPDES